MLNRSRLLWATLPLTLAALSAAPSAWAQTAGTASTGNEQTPAGDTTPVTAPDTGDEIVVTGSYASSLAAATQTKRQAGYGVDAINATDIGKFPAQNVAEALQLIPGVTITRPRGEGLYVSVRGLGP
ncbi:MAG: TonB-dependent receptor, partial [Lysobacteraceae bacterium]